MSNTAVALDLMILDIQNSNCLPTLEEAPVYTGLKLTAIITFGVVWAFTNRFRGGV